MKDYVIYTVLVGDYDDITQPVVTDDRFDYVLFSNHILKTNIGVWNVKSIPNIIENDNKRLSRYPKTHPETMLSEYKASLYIDANIQIQDQWVYDRFIELYNQNVEFAGIRMVLTGRDCIYDHAFDMCFWVVEHDYNAIKQCHELYKRGFPRHFGLNENNLIFRIHTQKMKSVDEEWWNWILNYSFRDQFSYMYCLWKYNVELNYFLPIGEDTRNSKHFHLNNHDGRTSVIRKKIIPRSLIERLRIKSKSFDKDYCLNRWHSIYESSYPILYLYVDGIFTIIRSLPQLAKLSFQRK